MYEFESPFVRLLDFTKSDAESPEKPKKPVRVLSLADSIALPTGPTRSDTAPANTEMQAIWSSKS